VNETQTIRQAAIGAAALGPGIGAIPYALYFVFEVASRGTQSGLVGVLAGAVAAAFYVLIVLIAAYVAGVIPAAIVGGTYAYALQRWPRLAHSHISRTISASVLAFVTCLLWTLSFGQLAVAEYVGKMMWTVVACGVFAAVVLAYFGAGRRVAA
jgi:hypothetical protein